MSKYQLMYQALIYICVSFKTLLFILDILLPLTFNYIVGKTMKDNFLKRITKSKNTHNQANSS